MNKWSKLPNAKHIDWVIQSLKNKPELWLPGQPVARLKAKDMAKNMATDMDRVAAWYAVWDKARDYRIRHDAAFAAAWAALAALIAYDDCDQYLQMTFEELKVYAILSERPQAILLLPMKWVQENECLVTSAQRPTY